MFHVFVAICHHLLVSGSPQRLLLQALNGQNQAAIDERLATEDVKVWINRHVLPKQLENPIKEFEDDENITCLSFASLVSDDTTVRQLIQAGADVTVADGRGKPALHHVCENEINSPRVNRADRVRALMHDYGASVNATDRSDCTALRLAAGAGHTESVKVLLQHQDCCVNASDRRGSTALHRAAEAGHAEAVEVLVSHPRCDVSITDVFGDTAADLARGRRHDDIAALIEAKAKSKFAEK